MEQQTAVEWFVQQLEESGIDMGNGIKMAYPIPYDIYKEAKAMEKEQIIKFAMKMHQVDCSKTGIDLLLDEAEQYYNETYQSRQDKPDK